MLKEDDIRNLVEDQIYSRGKSYFYNGYVEEITQVSKTGWECYVQGSQRNSYKVEIDLSDEEEPSGDCSCPYWDTCKHFVAALLAIRQHQLSHRYSLQNSNPSKIKSLSWKEKLSQLNINLNNKINSQPILSPLSVKVSISTLGNYPQLMLGLYATHDSYGNKRNSKAGVTTYYFNSFSKSASTYSYNLITGKKYPPKVRPRFSLSLSSEEEEFLGLVNSACTALGKGQYAVVEENVGVIMDAIQKVSNVFDENNNKIAINNMPLKLRYELAKENEDYLIRAIILDEDNNNKKDNKEPNIVQAKDVVVFGTPSWAIYANQYRPLEQVSDDMQFSLSSLAETITIPKKDRDVFMMQYFEGLANNPAVIISKDITEEFFEIKPAPILLLSNKNNSLASKVLFRYGDGMPQVNTSTLHSYVKGVVNNKEYWFKRNHEAENSMLAEAAKYIAHPKASQGYQGLDESLNEKDGNLWHNCENMLEGKEAVLFVKNIPALKNLGWKIEGENMCNKYQAKKAEVQVRIGSGIDWFEVENEIEINGNTLPLDHLHKISNLSDFDGLGIVK